LGAWEDAIVRDGYASALPCAEIARQLPQRSAASVAAAHARRLGLVSYARRWSTNATGAWRGWACWETSWTSHSS
jgi:hypothetical protein